MKVVYVCMLSCVQLSAGSWTVVLPVPLSMELSRQEYRSRLPRAPPGALPDSGIKPTSLASPARAGGFFTISLVTQTVKDLPAMQET